MLCCRRDVRRANVQLQQEPMLEGGKSDARPLSAADPVSPPRNDIQIIEVSMVTSFRAPFLWLTVT
jgi:hypothetical protein